VEPAARLLDRWRHRPNRGNASVDESAGAMETGFIVATIRIDQAMVAQSAALPQATIQRERWDRYPAGCDYGRSQ